MSLKSTEDTKTRFVVRARSPRWNLVRLLGACCLFGGFLFWAAAPVSGATAAPSRQTTSAGPASADPAEADIAVAANSAGTIGVSPGTVSVSASTKLIFTYDPGHANTKGPVTVTVPAGWTPPSPNNGSSGYTTMACQNCTVGALSILGPLANGDYEIKADFANLSPPYSLQIIYSNATAPSSPGNFTFSADEGSVALSPPPMVNVACPDGVGTMTVSPPRVTASAPSHLTFTYTAAGCGVLAGGEVAVRVPSGWTSASATSTTSSSGSVTVSNSLITVTGATLKPGAVLILHYTGTAPPSTGRSAFPASEESAKGGTLTTLASLPQVRVRPPVVTATTPVIPPSPSASVTRKPPPRHAGADTMTVSPTSVIASRPSTLTFTFMASRAGLAPSGVVALTVPRGWTPPTLKSSAPGYTSASTGKVAISGRKVRVTGARLGPRHTLTIVYHDATAPPHPGPWKFRTRARSSHAAGVARLTTSPVVMVTTAAILSPSPSTAPLATALVVIPGIILASAAWFLLRRGRLVLPASVAAVSGRTVPGVTTVRDLGPDAPLIVRIEPHPGSSSIRTEEAKR
jgi:hypothetical protein